MPIASHARFYLFHPIGTTSLHANVCAFAYAEVETMVVVVLGNTASLLLLPSLFVDEKEFSLHFCLHEFPGASTACSATTASSATARASKAKLHATSLTLATVSVRHSSLGTWLSQTTRTSTRATMAPTVPRQTQARQGAPSARLAHSPPTQSLETPSARQLAKDTE